MPPEAFMMTGGASPFRVADACLVTQGPHIAPREQGAFLVADAATRDRSATVRVVAWRCQFCGVLLVGIGRTDAPIDSEPGSGVHLQEFTWLEEDVVLLDEQPAQAENL